MALSASMQTAFDACCQQNKLSGEFVDYFNLVIGFVEQKFPATTPYIEFVLRFIPPEKIINAVTAAWAAWAAGGNFMAVLKAALAELLKQQGLAFPPELA